MCECVGDVSVRVCVSLSLCVGGVSVNYVRVVCVLSLSKRVCVSCVRVGVALTCAVFMSALYS